MFKLAILINPDSCKWFNSHFFREDDRFFIAWKIVEFLLEIEFVVSCGEVNNVKLRKLAIDSMIYEKLTGIDGNIFQNLVQMFNTWMDYTFNPLTYHNFPLAF